MVWGSVQSTMLWLYLVVYSIVYMLLGFSFERAGGIVFAALGPTVHCPVIDSTTLHLGI